MELFIVFPQHNILLKKHILSLLGCIVIKVVALSKSQKQLHSIVVNETIYEIVEKIKDHCISILLTGSWGIGKEKVEWDSDLDFILVVKNDGRAKKLVKEIINNYNKSFGLVGGIRERLDCKIYTEQELRKMLMTERNFYLFSCFSNGVTIYGKDFRKEIRLNTNLFINHLKNQLGLLEGTVELIRRGILFKAVCFNLYFILKTFYFAEMLLRGKSGSPKNRKRFFVEMFGDMLKVVRKEAYKLMRSVDSDEFDMHIRIKVKKSDIIPREKKEKLLLAAQKILLYARNIYTQAQKINSVQNKYTK